MLQNAAMEEPSLMRAEFDKGSKRPRASDGDRKWSAWMRGVEHPKRSTIVFMITSLAAAEFWKHANKITDNPFKKTNSDVVVAEALMFFWYHFFLFVRDAVKKNELTQADNQAVATAGTTIVHVIQETTQWPTTEIFVARMNEYEHRDTSQNPIEGFSGVLLRSIGKQSINDPDSLDPLSLDDTPIVAQTMAHMIAKLPAYIEVYKNIVEHYEMD
jgi:hypothetical protein